MLRFTPNAANALVFRGVVAPANINIDVVLFTFSRLYRLQMLRRSSVRLLG